MKVDFDTPRTDPDAPTEDELITETRTHRPPGHPTPEPPPTRWLPELHERLDIVVVPAQADEFTCARCHLICHRSRRVLLPGGTVVCRDCT